MLAEDLISPSPLEFSPGTQWHMMKFGLQASRTGKEIMTQWPVVYSAQCTEDLCELWH